VSRVLLDRLWPLLTGLAALIAGVLLLEGYAARRAADPLRIVIQDERLPSADEDGPEAPPALERGEEEPPVSPRHAQARTLARRAELARALPLYEAELAERPDDPALLAEYGTWLAASGAPDRALAPLEKAAALRPSFATTLRLGQVRARTGDPGAEADLRRALGLRPGSATASLALGQLLLRRGEVKEATGLLETASASGSNEDRARALVALGGAHLEGGRQAAAEKAFEQAILYAPARADVRLGIARAWLGRDGRDGAQRAVQVLLKAAELTPDLPQVHVGLGRARERTGEDRLAQDAYEQALRLDPLHRYARRRLVRLALSRNDLVRARHEAERLVADGPEVPEHHFLAARVATADGRRDDARAAYRRAIEAAKGDYPEAYLNLGVLERSAGDFAAARAAYDQALRLRPAYPTAWINVGKLEEAQGRTAEAERAYLQALEVDPRSAAAWLALGQLRSALGRWDEAEEALRRSLALDGRSAARLSLGVVYARAGKLDEAVAEYERVVRENPRNVAAWYDLALAERRRARPDAQRAALSRALEIDPGHAGSLLELAELELALRRLPEARRAFEDLLDVAPGDRVARGGLARVDALAGNRAACEARVAKLRAEAPADPAVLQLAPICAASVTPAAAVR
jgi:tetratricopeptide (TPR) repeat protein